MYEHKRQPLASKQTYYKRLTRNFLVAWGILGIFLLIGTIGYRVTSEVAWIDALHNASMILSGMGPVITISTFSGKIFSSAYALFSGVVFITNIGIILAPGIHRLYHSLHIEQ